jgi:hypothetical protein
MTSTIKTAIPDTLMLFVHENINVFEVYWGTSCSFEVFIVDNKEVSYGYQYVEPLDYKDNLSRAYDILFNETLKRLQSKGVNLSL